MAFRLQREESVQAGVRRIAAEQIDRALGEIADDALDHDQTVHQVRKRCKKLRGLVRLVRPAFETTYRRENAWFRDAARELSSVRDADVLLATFENVVKHNAGRTNNAALAQVRAALEEYRRWRRAQDGGRAARLEQFAERLRQARPRVGAWSLDSTGFAAIAGGLEENYRRGREAMKTAYADPTAENFHEWRKRTKYLGHHLDLLCNLWKPAMTVHRDAADELSQLLGDEHDLAVLQATLLSEEWEPAGDIPDQALLIDLIDRRRQEIQTAAHPLGARVFAEKPSCLTVRLKKYWKAWRSIPKTECSSRSP